MCNMVANYLSQSFGQDFANQVRYSQRYAEAVASANAVPGKYVTAVTAEYMSGGFFFVNISLFFSHYLLLWHIRKRSQISPIANFQHVCYIFIRLTGSFSGGAKPIGTFSIFLFCRLIALQNVCFYSFWNYRVWVPNLVAGFPSGWTQVAPNSVDVKAFHRQFPHHAVRALLLRCCQ